MTREEARIRLIEIKAQLQVLLSMYGLEISDVFDIAIKALEQESILDKIRAEFISLYPKNFAGEPELGGSSCVFSLKEILCIIDKYRQKRRDKK